MNIRRRQSHRRLQPAGGLDVVQPVRAHQRARKERRGALGGVAYRRLGWQLRTPPDLLFAGASALLSIFMNNLAAAALVLPKRHRCQPQNQSQDQQAADPRRLRQSAGRSRDILHHCQHHRQRPAHLRQSPTETAPHSRLHSDRRTDRNRRDSFFWQLRAASAPGRDPGPEVSLVRRTSSELAQCTINWPSGYGNFA